MQYQRELVHRALTYVTLAAFAITMLITPPVSSAQTTPPTHGALTVPITGAKAVVPGSNAASNFTGSFTIQQFIAQDDKLFAVGTVVGHTATGGDIVAHGVQPTFARLARRQPPMPAASNWLRRRVPSFILRLARSI